MTTRVRKSAEVSAPARGIATTAQLRARCTVDPQDRNPYDPCWLWGGSLSSDGRPRIWTVDLDRGVKTSLSGPKAVHYIATGKPLQGALAFRKCGTRTCVNPSHHGTAPTKAAMFAFLAAAGFLKGTAIESRRENVRKAWAACGTVPTPAPIVLAIRQAPESTTSSELGRMHGLSPQTVSAIRRGKSRREVRA